MVEIYNPQSEGVAEINGLTGDVTIAAGTNITLGTVGNTITINSAGLIENTEVNILALTPTAGLNAFATDTLNYFIADGTNWNRSMFPHTVDNSNPDMGLPIYNNSWGYGIDYISNKSLNSTKFGFTANNEEGAVRVNTQSLINFLQVYLNGVWKNVTAGFTFREVSGVLQTLPVGYAWWYEVYSGNSDLKDSDGSPFVKGYITDIGAYAPF